MIREDREFRIYYEDTDAGGVTYHANYLHFMERARTEMIDKIFGIPFQELNKKGIIFVVYELHIKYKRPALLGDVIIVKSELEVKSKFRLTFKQNIIKKETQELLTEATVEVVCVNKEGKLIEIPDQLYDKILHGS